MADPITNPTDYDLIGGGRAVSAVVDRFYELVLADPELAPYFTSTDMNRLKRHQVLLVSQVLGGPGEYNGRDLREAHEGRGISSADFNRVVTHLVTALTEAGVPPAVIGRIGEALGGTAKDIVEVESG
jgi:hemoglobin